ncbi:MAG: hypothetical protein ACI9H8_000043 [Lysobacterales bacterium]|jgi:uncharacterized protein (DUF885 family)
MFTIAGQHFNDIPKDSMMKKLLLTLVLGSALISGVAVSDYKEETQKLMDRVVELSGTNTGLSDTQRLNEIFDIAYNYTMENFPEFATFRGDPRGQDRWSDSSEAAMNEQREHSKLQLAALKSIDRDALSDADKVNLDMMASQIEMRHEGFEFPGEFMPINQMGGPQQDIAQMMSITRPRNVNDYQNMVKRLETAAEQIDDAILWMRKGMEAGVTPPKITLRDVPQQIRNQLVDDPSESPLLGAFKQMPASVDSLQGESLQKQAQAAFSEKIAPAYERLLTFMEEEYIPAARESIALRDMPNGEAWYAYNVKQRTTTDLSPKEIHNIGLSEVARIRSEMDTVIATSGFEGSFEEFLHFLRTDPQFYHTTKEGLLQEYRDIAKRADPELMKVFGHLPRTPYGVIPIPSYAEKSQTTAYYQRGSVEAGRPGYFYANTYALDTRPRWEMEALTLHEAVPGHHLQLSIQAELEDVPWFRKTGGYTGYTEGWGLYSESLGEEMGFYKDPYSKFGQLTYEMWRAVRLVVDTGMHQFGWSRQKAIDYFMANAPKQEHDVIVEIDRYIVWPGQALAYKLGELKFKELRAFASQELGEDFDVRDFHDQALGNGSMPLHMLDANIRAWVAGKKAE